MSDAAEYNLLIAGTAAASLIFVIMLIITRSAIAALVIIGTVMLSLGTSFGLSVLVWQDILGIRLHWLVIAMAVIVLLAVGSDYTRYLARCAQAIVLDATRRPPTQHVGRVPSAP